MQHRCVTKIAGGLGNPGNIGDVFLVIYRTLIVSRETGRPGQYETRAILPPAYNGNLCKGRCDLSHVFFAHVAGRG